MIHDACQSPLRRRIRCVGCVPQCWKPPVLVLFSAPLHLVLFSLQTFVASKSSEFYMLVLGSQSVLSRMWCFSQTRQGSQELPRAWKSFLLPPATETEELLTILISESEG